MSAAAVDIALDFSKTSPLHQMGKTRSPSPSRSLTSDSRSRSVSVSSDQDPEYLNESCVKPVAGPIPTNHLRDSTSPSESERQNNVRPFKMYPMQDPLSSSWYPGLSSPGTDILSAYSATTTSVPLGSSLNSPVAGMNPLYETGLSALSLPISALLNRKRPRYQDPETCVKKGKQIIIPDDNKDEFYWERRRKNNDAAKRSRDSRRVKEEEIALRAAFLEQENLKLRAQVAILKSETAKLHYMLYSRSCS